MYEITTESTFAAAHHLSNYNGPCENVHGHNWLVKLTVRCTELDKAGIGVDFRILRAKLAEVLKELDHVDLNLVLSSAGLNPSSENIARYVFGKMREAVSNTTCSVYKVEVFETPGNSASYFEEQ